MNVNILEKTEINQFGRSIITGIETRYKHGPIYASEFHNKSGKINFIYSNGDVKCVDISKHHKFEVVYNGCYGISITKDGRYFFVQSWEKGLFCFSIETGAIVWHHKQKKATILEVYDRTLVCHFAEKYLALMALESGEVLKTYSTSSEQCNVFVLSDNCFFVGPKRRKYTLFDNQLNEIVNIPSCILNPEEYDYFGIVDAHLVNDGISISGNEYSSSNYQQAIQSNTFQEFNNNSRYTRHIPLAPRIMSLITMNNDESSCE